jgi:starch synthase
MPKESLKILHVAAEMTPLISTGGLAEVVNALPKAQRALGHDVRVAMPCYQSVPVEHRGRQVTLCEAHLSGRTVHGALRESKIPETEIPLYLVEHEGYFGRSKPYGHDHGEYGDNAERFSFFCHALLDALPKTGWVPDVINCHDWHAAPFVIALKSSFKDHPAWGGKPVIYTIHNLNYQGRFAPDQFPYTGLDPALFHGGCLEYFGDLNLMKGAITLADKVSTVSPRYAREIQTSDYGAGLDGVLRARAHDLRGILNGIDYEVWNPTRDPHMKAPFTRSDLSGKALCKAALQDTFGLPRKSVPLFGVVSRLTWQKGVDLIIDAFKDLHDAEFQMVMLGTGDTWLENQIISAAQHHAGKLAVILRYDSAIAHQIQGGADFFLMPSRYEPCGLSQLYSFAYGTVPIVRRTGGLADSVRNLSRVGRRDGNATGIVFAAATWQAVGRGMRQAIDLYEKPEQFRAVQAAGMAEDFSWNRACEDYLAMYRESLAAA